MPLRIDNLERALNALEGSLERVQDDSLMGALDEIAQNTMMSGVIQHFEFTYEICRALIERWLRENHGREIRSVSRKDLYRIAGERELIDGVERWFTYHEERNRTSHRYDEELLNMVNDAVPQFIEDARALLDTLEARNA